MNLEEYKKTFNKDDTVGWSCIDRALEKLYGKGEPLGHFATIIPYQLGGKDPLDGISVYESDKQSDHFHFASYGFSALYYDEECVGNEFSGFGFELTFRLKKKTNNDSLNWACNLMQNLARYVFDSGKWFDEYHVIPANGPIRLDYDTDIVALAFVLDPELQKMNTPHGVVKFLQMVGLTSKEYEEFRENPVLSQTEKIIKRLRVNNELLITDLDRKQ